MLESVLHSTFGQLYFKAIINHYDVCVYRSSHVHGCHYFAQLKERKKLFKIEELPTLNVHANYLCSFILSNYFH